MAETICPILRAKNGLQPWRNRLLIRQFSPNVDGTDNFFTFSLKN